MYKKEIESILRKGNLKEISDWLIDDNNKVKDAIVIAIDDEDKIFAFGTDDLTCVHAIGLLGLTKVEFIDHMHIDEDVDDE